VSWRVVQDDVEVVQDGVVVFRALWLNGLFFFEKYYIVKNLGCDYNHLKLKIIADYEKNN
jgi:hypothetical protein